MRKILLFLFPIFLFAENLKTILEYAHQNNNLIISAKYAKEAKAEIVESKKSSYFPTIDVGGFYENKTNTTYFQIPDTYGAYSKINLNIYDGGMSKARLNESKNEYLAASYDESEMKKSLSLEVVRDFFEYKSLEAHLKAKEDAKKSIAEQLERVKRFVEAKLATQDDVQRLQAAYDTTLYEMESLTFEILSIKKHLELRVGKKLQNLEDSSFDEADFLDIEEADAIKSLLYKQNAMLQSAEAIESIYYPTINFQDIYSYYGYKNIESNHPAKIDYQNIATLTLNMRIFDYGAQKEVKKSLLLSSKAINEEIVYKTDEQKMYHELSIIRLNSAKLKIKSANSALDASKSAFETISKKYSAGIVDYVVYLEALSASTNAKALYKRSLNDMQVAYAMLYYYSGKKIEEYIR